ncbi:VOC family protein [Candidatus Peribacteria bacterium]|nr:VOC family protein [Candidatus Peribacteria bacterium]
MTSLATCIWLDGKLEAAAAFYTRVFPDAQVLYQNVYTEPNPLQMPAGTPMTLSLRMAGHDFLLLNGGPEYQLTPAMSLMLWCSDQAEIDHYWSALVAEGGEDLYCGWVRDPFGVSWQILPTAYDTWMREGTPAQCAALTQALWHMRRLDIAALQQAYSAAMPSPDA